MATQVPRLSDYSLHADTGFLPPSPPLTHLPNAYYETWESAISNLSSLVSSASIRTTVTALPILSTSNLTTEAELQRAYTILTFLTHGYIWAPNVLPVTHLPAALSVPLLEVSGKLGMLPSVSYASLCLWNMRPTLPTHLDRSDPGDLIANCSFTGDEGEAWFYAISVAIEARGAPVVTHLLDTIQAVRNSDTTAVTQSLERAAGVLGSLLPILARTGERLEPAFFWGGLRPFLAGSGSLPDGLVFETETEAENEELAKRYAGGSAAQSSFFQFCDMALGVEHGEVTAGVLRDMRRYMPGKHRKLLEDVAAVANVKEFVMESGDARVEEAYAACLAALKGFRERHIAVVTRFIVIPSKKAAKEEGEKGDEEEGGGKGTGGTAVIPFLKAMRDETGK